MSQNAFTLESLLETHDLPFAIISVDLKIAAVNRAWELAFGVDRQQQIGKPCCADNRQCRHRQLFHSLESYAGVFGGIGGVLEDKLFNVRGFPLLDADDRLFLGETLTAISKTVVDDNDVALIGKSVVFAACREKLTQAAQSDVVVMLSGEIGTGKALAAEFIHRHSGRSNAEFVGVDCSIVAEELFESELFGYRAEAIDKQGLLDWANHGTLFLNQIDALSLAQQSRLLSFLVESCFYREGGFEALIADVRVIAASQRNIGDLVKAGLFLEDLYRYLFAGIQISMVSLYERRQDIPLLVDYFLQRLDAREESCYSISQQALIKLLQYSWPGNVRELRDCLQLAAGLSHDHLIQDTDIHFISFGKEHLTDEQSTTGISPVSALALIEAEFINTLILKHQGNRKLIAQEMNISERTLAFKLNRLKLN